MMLYIFLFSFKLVRGDKNELKSSQVSMLTEYVFGVQASMEQ